jgi:large subunit ribosomal protein L30
MAKAPEKAKKSETVKPSAHSAAKAKTAAKAKSSQTVTMLKVEQYGSAIRRPGVQQKILTGLGLGRIGSSKTLPDNSSTRGMIAKVAHMVRVVEE